MTIYKVLLTCGTIGTINSECLDGQSAKAFIGEIVNVHLHRDGMPIEVEGKLAAVLEQSLWYR
jgi:hypothetical protein